MKTAVYSTLYPQMMPYLRDFLDSVRSQTDTDFDLWLGLDQVGAESVTPHYDCAAEFVESQGRSIAEFRAFVLTTICDQYDAVVLVDSDDILLPNRVRQAKSALQNADVSGCALRLIDRAGVDLKSVFDYQNRTSWEADLSRRNVIGFSNSAYRCTVLKKCFPYPADTVLVDWLTVSVALDHGAAIQFDSDPQMLYRQYSENTAAVVGPFSPERIRLSAQRVLEHYQLLFQVRPIDRFQNQTFKVHLLQRQADVQRFAEGLRDPDILRHYTDRINDMHSVFCWWEMIAHPNLESLWT